MSIIVVNEVDDITVVVEDDVTSFVVEEDDVVLSDVTYGLQGAAGPPGGTYTHTQLTPSASWAIVHNLGFRPSVFVVDSSGNWVIGDINWTSDNGLTVSFTGAFAGSAYLS